jgi:hypothetical protein
MKGDIEAIIGCFISDARVRIRHGDAEERRFTLGADGEGLSAREFYGHLISNFACHFAGFKHFIDLDEERSAATFVVTLEPRPDSTYLSEGTQTLHNCNFFEYRDGKIADMIIYYSNPTAGAAGVTAPTGYPPAD